VFSDRSVFYLAVRLANLHLSFRSAMLLFNASLFFGLIAPVCICMRTSSYKSGRAKNEQEVSGKSETNTESQRKGKIGLIVVDVQDCFTENGVGLGNPRGNAEYKKNVNNFVKEVVKHKGAVILLQDYHPEDHISFGTVATNNTNWKWLDQSFPQLYEGPLCEDAVDWDNKEWFSKESAAESNFVLDADKYLPMRGTCKKSTKHITQPLFPSHCVQGTAEVKHTEGLCEAAGGTSVGDTCEPNDSLLKVVRKGMNPGIDSFGGIYDNRVVQNILEPTEEKAHWGLFHYFKEQGVTHVIHIGIADDYCVKDTSFAAASELAKKYGIQSASVVPSLTYGIIKQLAERDGETPKDQSLIDEYTNAGVKIETVQEALARFG